MVGYLRAVWGCRYFWLSLVKMDLRARYRGSVIGVGWSLLNPVIMSTVLCVIFAGFFKQPVHEFGPYLFAGLTFWNFFAGVTQGGCACFFQGEAYIRQHPAPMAIYPLRTVLGCAFHYAVALVAVFALAVTMRGGLPLLPLLSLVPGMALLMVLGWSAATLMGLANVRFRDTRHLSDIVLQVLFYVTPVIWKPDMLAGRRLAVLLHVNPLLPFLRILRDPIHEGVVPGPGVFGAAALIALASAVMAAVALRVEERRLIFHL